MNSAHGPCACAARSRSNATSCSAWWHSRSIKYSASRSSGPRRPERRPLRPREHRENSPRSMNFARGSKNILQLNMTMFELYDNAGQIFRRNILAEHPLILGLFAGAGGRFILYRPGMAPLEAPSTPVVYQLLKSVAHSTTALAEVVVPYLNSPMDLSWRSSLAAYRSRMQSALDGLDATDMQ